MIVTAGLKATTGRPERTDIARRIKIHGTFSAMPRHSAVSDSCTPHDVSGSGEKPAPGAAEKAATPGMSRPGAPPSRSCSAYCSGEHTGGLQERIETTEDDHPEDDITVLAATYRSWRMLSAIPQMKLAIQLIFASIEVTVTGSAAVAPGTAHRLSAS